MEQPGCILVTGAGGFMGRYLLPALHDAFPAARLVATTRSGRTGFERLNVTDRDAVRQIIDAVRPQVCIHLAGITSVPTARQYPEQAWDVNLHGTLTVARALHECMPDATMVYASSSEIYGRSFADGLALNEQVLLAPRNTYAASKAAADLALGALCEDGLKAVRLRLFNHTGPGQSPDFAIPAFARQIARIERGLQPPVLNTGALDPARDFLDVRDACAAYVACVQRLAELPPNAVLNIASGIPRRIGDALQSMLRIAGIQVRIETSQARLRGGDIAIACGDAGQARRLLQWEATIPWETTLTDVLKDWRLRVVDEH